MLSTTVHPDIKRTLVAISERTGLSVSQITDEVLYTGLAEMQEQPELQESGGWAESGPRPLIHKVVSRIYARMTFQESAYLQNGGLVV